MSVKFPDGTILNTGNMIDIYTRTLEGMDSIWSSGVLADRKKGNLSTYYPRTGAIENRFKRIRYKKVGDYYLLVGE